MQPKKLTPRNSREVGQLSVRSARTKKKPKPKDDIAKDNAIKLQSPLSAKQLSSEPLSDGESGSKCPFEAPSKGPLDKSGDRVRKTKSVMERSQRGAPKPKTLKPWPLRQEEEKKDSASGTGEEPAEEKHQEQKSQGPKDLTKLKSGTVIQSATKTWVVKKILGTGGFGAVYQVQNQKASPQDPLCALKVEIKQDGKKSQIKRELAVYLDIAEAKKKQKEEEEGKKKEGEEPAPDTSHLPDLIDSGSSAEWKFVVMPFLGMSLQDIRMKLKRNFHFSSVMMYAKQALEAIISFHKLGWVHSDLKPHNFVTGRGPQQHLLFLLDFGISRKIIRDGEMIPQTRRSRFVGTTKYAPMAAHMGVTQSFRDDLESYIYLIFDGLDQKLMWSHSKLNDGRDIHVIHQIKQKFMKAEFGNFYPAASVPRFFIPMIQYVEKLKYEDTPDYEWMQLEVLRIAKVLKTNFEEKMDWMLDLEKKKGTKKKGKKNNGENSVEEFEEKSRDSIRIRKGANDKSMDKSFEERRKKGKGRKRMEEKSGLKEEKSNKNEADEKAKEAGNEGKDMSVAEKEKPKDVAKS